MRNRLMHFAFLLSLVLASVSNAATLSVTANKLTYSVGEQITLKVFGDDEGAIGSTIYGNLVFNGALVDNGGALHNIILVGPSGRWDKWEPVFLLGGDTNADAPNSAWRTAFAQATDVAQTANNLPGILSTVILYATAVGVVDIAWSTVDLSFFGL